MLKLILACGRDPACVGGRGGGGTAVRDASLALTTHAPCVRRVRPRGDAQGEVPVSYMARDLLVYAVGIGAKDLR